MIKQIGVTVVVMLILSIFSGTKIYLNKKIDSMKEGILKDIFRETFKNTDSLFTGVKEGKYKLESSTAGAKEALLNSVTGIDKIVTNNLDKLTQEAFHIFKGDEYNNRNDNYQYNGQIDNSDEIYVEGITNFKNDNRLTAGFKKRYNGKRDINESNQ